MKFVTVLLALALVLVAVFGTPIGSQLPEKAAYYGSPERILPMSFAHKDHASEQCVECHHNFIDDTGGGVCMNCHVSDEELWPVLESQYHELCMGCHVRKSVHGEGGGPPRRCIGCHVIDWLP